MSSPHPPSLVRDDLEPHVADVWPLPGHGDTLVRWEQLAAVAREDLPLAKLVEPHHDAVAILADLDEDPPAVGQVWAVWAAEPPFAVLDAVRAPGGWQLTGSKAFCSGADLVTHALVTAHTPDGSRLFSIGVDAAGITHDKEAPAWAGPGMQRAQTVTLSFDRVSARPVGEVGAYVDRPGFWFGSIGVAACWFGGALGIGDALERASGRLDAHGLAHLGAVRADLDTLHLALAAAARRVDDWSPADGSPERLAQGLRARASDVATSVISHVGRALGPGPLAFDADHAARAADLAVFVRQHHAERDLARLGAIGGADE